VSPTAISDYHQKLAKSYLSGFRIIRNRDEVGLGDSKLNGSVPKMHVCFDKFAASQMRSGTEYYEEPASLYHPELLYRNLAKFKTSRSNLQLNEFDFKEISGIARRYFSRNGIAFKHRLNPNLDCLQVLTPTAAHLKILKDKSNKAAGFPYFCKKGEVADAVSYYFRYIQGKLPSVSSIGYRTQRLLKVRPV
jgi:hypothetical protein